MKKSIFNKATLIVLAIGCLSLFSCISSVITGQTVKESRDVSGFSGVSLAFSGDVYITQGSPAKVEIEADKGILDIIISEVNGSTLVLKTKDGHWRDLGKIKAYVTLPDVNELTVTGSGDMICETPVKTNEIDLKVSGSGTVRISRMEVHEIDAEITGSGDIIIAGSTNEGELNATITGSGSIKAEEIAVGEADIRITGSGSANVNVTKELESNITGSGSVYYKGNPLINANATGSGKTRSIN